MSHVEMSAPRLLGAGFGVLLDGAPRMTRDALAIMLPSAATLMGAQYLMESVRGTSMWIGFGLGALSLWVISAMPWLVAGSSAAALEGRERAPGALGAVVHNGMMLGALNLLGGLFMVWPAMLVHAYYGASAPAAGLGSGDSSTARSLAVRQGRGHFASMLFAVLGAHAIFALPAIVSTVALVKGIDSGLPEWAFNMGVGAMYVCYTVLMASMQHGVLRQLERSRRVECA